MSDIIKLLPDSVANQIAAGEVIQRPASAVKEMMENSIDAGANSIKLLIKDAGKTLIQVIDDGSGMSETDARMCFERHATSKINNAKDLFSIRSLGFRGEALASIASIAKVELKTRTKNEQIGTELIVEGSAVKSQNPCQCPIGTSISVKNLFYNTPARRNFLKSDNVERSNIFSEFARIALAYPDIELSYYHNDKLIQKLSPGNLKQRIAGIYGNNYIKKLVPIEEETQIVKINGFIGKPEHSKKKRTEQFFFVNNRYIKSPYLYHALLQAYTDLISEGMHPVYFVFLDINPDLIDVNVHPTKSEIKFQDERFIYQIILASAKRALGKHNISPTLDFERETAFDDIIIDKTKEVKPPQIEVNPDFNPFEEKPRPKPGFGKSLKRDISQDKWEKIFPEKREVRSDLISSNINESKQHQLNVEPGQKSESSDKTNGKFFQVQNRYIACPVKSGLMLIDQQRAHERILFEKFLTDKKNNRVTSQTLLFPEQFSLAENDTQLLLEILNEIIELGFDICEFGKNTFVVNAIPVDVPENENIPALIESLLENFNNNQAELKIDIQTNICRSLARKVAIKHGKSLSDIEMNAIVDSLFACQIPNLTPSGKPTLIIIDAEELSGKFK